MGDKDTAYVERVSPPKPNARTVVIIIPDWPKCGSTLTFGSQIRSYDAMGWNVDVVMFSGNFWIDGDYSVSQDTIDRARKLLPIGCVRTIMVIHDRSSIPRFIYKFRNIILRRSRLFRHCTAYSHLKRSLARFRDFVASSNLIVCNRITFLDYVPKTVPVYLETHDVMSMTREMAGDDSAAAYELTLAARATAIGCFTESDAYFFSPLKVPVLRSTFSVATLVPEPARQRSVRVVYVGDNHPQNAKSLREALSSVPFGMTVQIVGRVGEAIRDCGFNNVDILGYVDDLAKTVSDAHVVVIPDYYGTGISIKALEALCWDKPLFATRKAFRGLEKISKPPEVALGPDEPAAFFPQLLRNFDEILSADWSAFRKAVLAAYSDDQAVSSSERVVRVVSDQYHRTK